MGFVPLILGDFLSQILSGIRKCHIIKIYKIILVLKLELSEISLVINTVVLIGVMMLVYMEINDEKFKVEKNQIINLRFATDRGIMGG